MAWTIRFPSVYPRPFMVRTSGIRTLVDGGPRYAETRLDRFPVEPLSAFSNLAFLVLVLYIVKRTRLHMFRHPLLVVSLPFMLLGILGGTMYHLTRASSAWLYLDFIAIFYLVLMLCIYLWRRVLNSWILAAGGTLLLPLIAWLAFTHMAREGADIPRSAVYVAMAMIVLLPGILHCWRNNLANLGQLAAAAAAFSVAVFFRELDTVLIERSGIGTHFLWHLAGALAAGFIVDYVLKTDDAEALIRIKRKVELLNAIMEKKSRDRS